ncbi:autocrine proliferation repressor protein A-like [Heteronotia binoei]|uniref:autocrine proliferation repressor protein A-like n=1 Tax=Heteronotia binoei TaxID=13085 RepID=UPI0029304F9D|nr:autocrine proliferation repressor protein A-like [Heteronotia binoei]
MHSLVLFLSASCLPPVWLMDQKALDEFVNLPDPHYEYTLLTSKLQPFHYFDTINMTSQKWLDESEVDKPYWSHELTILIPIKMAITTSCLLILQLDRNETSPPSHPFNKFYALIAMLQSRSIVAVLNPFPSQPLTFYDHPLGYKNITGYDAVAYSWWRFMNDPTAPPHWLVQFPMVKATVRAMDTITEYMKNKHHKPIERFTLTGISLGGWISWLTAAVDKRVEGIVPVAMDFLNFTESFHHQYRAYCGWSYMLKPFYEMNITQELDNPRFSDLARLVDPLAYNERYADTAKDIIIYSGDEFFPPDNSRYYFSQLEGTKYLQILPNYDYVFQEEKPLIFFIFPFYVKLTNTSGTIILRAYNVYRVYSYHADTVGGTRRDFRMEIAAGNSSKNNPVKWIQTELRETERDVYRKEMSMPAKGWRAFFIQVVYPTKMIVTSEMLIMPDTFPCSDCNGDGCRGTLV